jgi:hypothetical protein
VAQQALKNIYFGYHILVDFARKMAAAGELSFVAALSHSETTVPNI